MLKLRHKLLTAATFCAASLLTSGAAHAQTAACVPGFQTAFQAHQATYTALVNTLSPRVGGLTAALNAVADQATYAALLAGAHTIANTITNGRLVITVPDGTVVVDTGKPDDPNNTMASGNSYRHYQNKTVNENHNSRMAILTAQEFPCGLGIETKLSTTTGIRETYFAIRLGAQFDNSGTARLSTH
jgi:hypothetical protein